MKNSKSSSRHWFTIAAAVVFSAGTATSSFAQAPAPAPAIKVMVGLMIKAGTPRDELMKAMPDEVRATVKLYLDGKIDQWYSRTDGKGVVFFLHTKDADEAKALMDELPLAKSGFAEFTY